jgi:ATP-dependent RNA helicase MSS116
MVPLASWANVYPALLELINRESAKAQEQGTSPFKAIIYLNTSAAVELTSQVAFAIKREGQFPINIQHIMGKRSQEQRNRAADTFRKATSGVLISSDVTARGMDFPNVTHVIQIDAPRDRETYIHRLGRTGRADKSGEGWIFLPPNSVGPARRLLQGLPIQKNETLESSSSSITPAFDVVKKAYKSVYPDVRDEAYSTLISASTHNKIQLVDELNEWFTGDWGMDKPPSVSPHWAAKQNLSGANLNFERKPRTFTDEEGGDRMYGRRGDAHRAARNDSSDPFDRMRSSARRDDRGSGGRGSYGSFGGNRRSGGGFSGGRDRGSW